VLRRHSGQFPWSCGWLVSQVPLNCFSSNCGDAANAANAVDAVSAAETLPDAWRSAC